LRQESGTQSVDSEREASSGTADLVLCRVLGHRRSGSLVYTQGDGIWRSRCKRCGRKMVRTGRKRWAIDTG
jgi:hypothetical protein